MILCLISGDSLVPSMLMASDYQIAICWAVEVLVGRSRNKPHISLRGPEPVGINFQVLFE